MFLVVRKKSIIKICLIACLFVFLFVSVGASGVSEVYGNKSTRKIPVYFVETEEKKVALTFDAAWGADKTEGIIELLQKYDAIGTFFLVGFWIDKFEEETKKIAEAGFEIGNHSNNHLNMSKLGKDEINDEIVSVNNRIMKITGKSPKFFRAPFGDYNNKLIESVEGLNMVPVQWSIDSLDWKGLSGEDIYKRVIPNVKNGSIILFHNNSDGVLDALKLILPKLKADGYKMVNIGSLVMTENYYVDINGCQHKSI